MSIMFKNSNDKKYEPYKEFGSIVDEMRPTFDKSRNIHNTSGIN